MSKTNLTLSQCKICGTSASYSYYGAMACESCKMFFKRNADNKKKTFRCDFDGHCEINVYNRHICSACRLVKCFTVGMSTEMFRSSRVVKRKVEAIASTSSEVVPWKSRIPLQIRPLNLLNYDSSLLDSDQWALMRNLVHSYDERHAIQAGKEFVQELDRTHPKLRYRMSSKRILEICGLIYKQTEPCIRANRDFHTLSSHDRSIVLRGAVDNVSCFAGGFILWNSGLIIDSAVRKALENAFGTMAFNLTLLQISLLDQDLYTIKLTLALVAFCASNCTSYDGDCSTNHLRDPQKILSIENKYSELLWKYLLYKYSFSDAVRRFTQLVQCIVVSLTIRVYLQNIRNHTDVVDSLVQQIEQQQQIDLKDN
ncbi:unnamed protein product [Adineta ricciae]|uniref:Nuclear receptor domain-containing protein n=1 Tax=Adineta ricciae TaxID=249248 RepID=A0A815EZG8_ADIRI|nr:unnamed protein product [Adineta ricciae]